METVISCNHLHYQSYTESETLESTKLTSPYWTPHHINVYTQFLYKFKRTRCFETFQSHDVEFRSQFNSPVYQQYDFFFPLTPQRISQAQRTERGQKTQPKEGKERQQSAWDPSERLRRRKPLREWGTLRTAKTARQRAIHRAVQRGNQTAVSAPSKSSSNISLNRCQAQTQRIRSLTLYHPSYNFSILRSCRSLVSNIKSSDTESEDVSLEHGYTY